MATQQGKIPQELVKESQFFQSISKKLLRYVGDNLDTDIHLKQKDTSSLLNYATQVDLNVEELVAKEIRERFPGDSVLAEETHSALPTERGRTWIIDPICGTSNLARGIKFYSTNIALAQGDDLIASCVIDHSQEAYIYSIGNGEIFVNSELHESHKIDKGIMIDLDLACLPGIDPAKRRKYLDFVAKVCTDTDYTFVTHATSLGFAYVALGKLDAYVNPFTYAWDVAAANFLISQNGGSYSDISGGKWKISSTSSVAAQTPALHQELIQLLNWKS